MDFRGQVLHTAFTVKYYMRMRTVFTAKFYKRLRAAFTVKFHAAMGGLTVRLPIAVLFVGFLKTERVKVS